MSLPYELRYLLAERLGLVGNDGWESIKELLIQFGNQHELIYAAGLCHHNEARDYLLQLFDDNAVDQLIIVRALGSCGAILRTDLLDFILENKSKSMRLAGLELLSFKLHLVDVPELIDLVEHLLDDYRDEVVIRTIKVIQRSNSKLIINLIGKVATRGSQYSAKEALIALGAIGTKNSKSLLRILSKQIVNKDLRVIAQKQLALQEIFDL